MSSISSQTRRRRIAGERRGTADERTDDARLAPPPQSHDRKAPRKEPRRRPEKAATPGERPKARRAVGWRSLVVLTVLAVASVTLAAGPLVPGVGVQAVRAASTAEATEAARRTAPAAAERAAVAILAYDHSRLETDRDAAARFMTPQYRRQYLRTFNGAVLDAAAERRAKVTAEVRASGVSLASEDRVEVLLFVNQTTVSRSNAEPQLALNRVILVMQRSGTGWLVDDITSY